MEPNGQRAGPSISSGGSGLPSRVIFYGVEKIGKCLGKGTPVIMFDGSRRPVEDVREGDLLMGPDSTPRRVSGVVSGRGPLYRVHQSKGDSYVVNRHHVLSLKRDNVYGCATDDVVNMPLADYLALSGKEQFRLRGWKASIEWSETLLPVPPYLFGAWLGDGTSSGSSITTADAEVEAATREYADANGMHVNSYRKSGANCATLAVAGVRPGKKDSNALLAGLRDLDVLNNKHIPAAYLASSRAQRLELLAGIVDTDGYLCGRHYEVVSSRHQLVTDVAFLCRSLGFSATINACMKSCTNAAKPHSGLYYRMCIGGKLTDIPTRVERRRDVKPRQFYKAVNTCRLQIEELPEGDFYGFELDGDHLFLLGDFTVTHNTSWAANAVKPVFGMTFGETGLLSLIDAGVIGPTPHFDELKSWRELQGAVAYLIDHDTGHRTFVVDTMNGAQELLFEHCARTKFGGDRTKFGAYGKGVEDVALPLWRDFLASLDSLRAKRKTAVIMLCHARVRNHKNPEGDDFSRYMADMNEKVYGLAQKWADVIVFAKTEVAAVKDYGALQAKGRSQGQRTMHTEWSAAWDAGNRYGLPPEISMGRTSREAWTNFATAMKEARQRHSQPVQAVEQVAATEPMVEVEAKGGV